MNIRHCMVLSAFTLGCVAMAAPFQTSAAPAGTANVDCKLTYSLTGWAAIVKHAKGRGMVTCTDGSSMPVKITVKGGGLTAGKWHVDNGHGKFSDVHTINDVLGSYAQAGAHAGAVKSGSAQVLTKGPVSLALAGTGEGVDLGVDVGKFTISRAK